MRRLVCRIFPKKTFSLCYFLLGLLACLALSVGLSRNVSATSVSQVNLIRKSARYYRDSDGVLILAVANEPTYNLSAIGGHIMDYVSEQSRLLKGIYIESIPTSGGSTQNKFNSVSLQVTLWQYNPDYSNVYDFNTSTFNDQMSASFTAHYNNNTFSYGHCTSSKAQSRITYTCSVVNSDYNPVISMDFSVGNWRSAAEDDPTLARNGFRVSGGSTAPSPWIFGHILMGGVSYNYTSSPDPVVGGQETIINQNQTIINQNEEVINSINNLNNTVDNLSDKERDKLNHEADGYLDDINNNTDQQAIDNKMTSIFSVIQNFVNAVIHPVISTCILPMDFRNYTGMGFYEVDLCHLSPPSGVTEVLNVIFIFFVLGLAYSAIRSVISMYKEVIDG